MCIDLHSALVLSFEMWFDVERLSVADADEKIVKEEQQKNILSMLHQVNAFIYSDNYIYIQFLCLDVGIYRIFILRHIHCRF
jgi:hypothetical protein